MQEKYVLKMKKQHARGRLHAIERIEKIVDLDTFQEIGTGILGQIMDETGAVKQIEYDGVITGYARIGGRTVFLFSQDFSVVGGTLGEKHGKKIAAIIAMAIQNKAPVIGIYDSGGARIHEGVKALAGCGEMLYYTAIASGYIPQIAVVLGSCAGAAAYAPGLSDFVFTTQHISSMFITGPEVANKVIGEKKTIQELGGAEIHAKKSGVAHFLTSTEEDCCQQVKRLISYLPSSCETKKEAPSLPFRALAKKIDLQVIPVDKRRPYNVRDVISTFVDDGSFFEIHKDFALNIVIGFARISGVVVSIVANQPHHLAGVLDCNSSIKAARFIRFSDAFHLPIITLVDTPGYMPGAQQEQEGIIRHGSKLLFAYSEATVPKITVILRKAYGGAYIAMCSKHLCADYVYALKNSEIAVMGMEGAVSIIYQKTLKNMKLQERNEFIKQAQKKYKADFINSKMAQNEGYVDKEIELQNIRHQLFCDLISLTNKDPKLKLPKKHANIPL